MSDETTETAETAPNATESPQTDENTEQVEDNGSDSPGREAAKYRRQLREVEAERDSLTERVSAMQRREVERVAGEHLTNPAGLWAADVDVNDLLDADGVPDPAKIADAAKSAAETLGLARPLGGNYVPSEGQTYDRTGSASPSFSDAFKPKAS